MAADRRKLPSALKRKLMEEAGYRCAIPTCRETIALEFAHIVPHADTQDDSYDNLIVLCANDHARFDKGLIDRRSILAYKQNLAVVTGRYGELERRVVDWFAEAGVNAELRLDYSPTTELQLQNLMRDGLLSRAENWKSSTYFSEDDGTWDPSKHDHRGVSPDDIREGGFDVYSLTPSGKEFVTRWTSAKPVADLPA